MTDEIGMVADQDYVVLADGRIVAVHGWTHPSGFVVGELVFTPDASGDRQFFGTRYSKAFVVAGRGRPERDRTLVRSPTGTFFDSAHVFSCKSIVPTSQVVRHIRSKWPRSEDLPGSSSVSDTLSRARAEVMSLLGAPVEAVEIGLTGSLALGLSEPSAPKVHDIDFVFTADLQSNANLVRHLSQMVNTNPNLRLREHGKGWQVRWRGRTALCCAFFMYQDPSAAPLADVLAMRTLIDNVTIVGRVIDDMHSAYVPSIVTIAPQDGVHELPQDAQSHLCVVMSHLRSRGDFARGALGAFTGSLVEIEARGATFLALSVVDGNSSRLLTPPWEPY